uniref:Secreted protein n=1 Tax=Anopheles merus TaxID=30066 RepID=A0A182VDS5_ANOME
MSLLPVACLFIKGFLVAVAAVAVVGGGGGVCFTKAAPKIVIMVIALRWINGSRSRAARGTEGSQEGNHPRPLERVVKKRNSNKKEASHLRVFDLDSNRPQRRQESGRMASSASLSRAFASGFFTAPVPRETRIED